MRAPPALTTPCPEARRKSTMKPTPRVNAGTAPMAVPPARGGDGNAIPGALAWAVAEALQRIADKAGTAGSRTMPSYLVWDAMKGVFTLDPVKLGRTAGREPAKRAPARPRRRPCPHPRREPGRGARRPLSAPGAGASQRRRALPRTSSGGGSRWSGPSRARLIRPVRCIARNSRSLAIRTPAGSTSCGPRRRVVGASGI